MTVHVPRLPFSLDPLVPEARRRMRRRRGLIAAALVLASTGVTAGILETRSPIDVAGKAAGLSLPAGSRPCGYVAAGIGWHAWANWTLSCRASRKLMLAYLTDPAKSAPAAFRGYACAPQFFPTGFGYSCVRGDTTFGAIANH